MQLRFSGMGLAQREQAIQAWAEGMLHAFGIELQLQGQRLLALPPERPMHRMFGTYLFLLEYTCASTARSRFLSSIRCNEHHTHSSKGTHLKQTNPLKSSIGSLSIPFLRPC